ncbi:hypothetical protein C8R43DRAFT_946523 [Mycena crocata]|nr:hypothetical protein C8R43DRAFT_946523 [Mycena crocata]
MVALFLHSTFLTLPLLSYFAAGSIIRVRRSPSKGNNVIVQLFKWPWDSVASECTSFLGLAGYGFAPPLEHSEEETSLPPYDTSVLRVFLTFRVDAARHMEPADISTIREVAHKPFEPRYGLIAYFGGGSHLVVHGPKAITWLIWRVHNQVSSNLCPFYRATGLISLSDIIEFGATQYAMTTFSGTSGATVSNLVTPVHLNEEGSESRLWWVMVSFEVGSEKHQTC